MLNLQPDDLVRTYQSAIQSAELLRESGELAKAARLESLARVIARELSVMKGSADGANRQQSTDR